MTNDKKIGEEFCAVCGCTEEEHNGPDGECTGCGEICEFDPDEDDEDEEGEDYDEDEDEEDEEIDEDEE